MNRYLYLFLILFSLWGCKKSVENQNPKKHEIYGLWDLADTVRGVELDLARIDTFHQIVRQTRHIDCEGKRPKIILKSESKISEVYLIGFCPNRCIRIKDRNVFEIKNDSVSNIDGQIYSLDSLENFFIRNIKNKGKDSRLSDSPYKLLISINYDSNGIEKLPKTLDLLIDIYEKIPTEEKALNLFLGRIW